MATDEMGSSLAVLYNTAKTSPVENFKHGCKMTWQHFCKGIFWEVKFLGQPQTLEQESRPPENSNLSYLMKFQIQYEKSYTKYCI